MSIKVQTYVWRIDTPPIVKLVAIALADHARDDGSEARPSQALLATKTGLSTQSVRRALSWLVAHGVIELVRPSTQHRANVFRFTLDESRGYTVAPLSESQGGQKTPQTYHTVTPALSESHPNHKESSLEPNEAVLIARRADEENERIRQDEIEKYGHVLSPKERLRLIRSMMKGTAFEADK